MWRDCVDRFVEFELVAALQIKTLDKCEAMRPLGCSSWPSENETLAGECERAVASTMPCLANQAQYAYAGVQVAEGEDGGDKRSIQTREVGSGFAFADGHGSLHTAQQR